MMRKAFIFAVAGMFFAGSAMACGYGSGKSAATDTQQTVMTDQLPAPAPVQTPAGGKG